MFHLMKYQFYKVIRQKEIMFWTLAFPLILGFMFNIAFGGAGVEENLETISVAVTGEENETFLSFLEEMDGDTIAVEKLSEEVALEKLNSDELDGIYYAKEVPTLTVGKSEIQQSILKSILDTYNKNVELMMTVVDHAGYDQINSAMTAMEDWQSTTEEVSVGGRTMNPYVSYFFALIAYACLSGAFMGLQGCMDSQANLSALGARQCVTPTHKMKMMIAQFLVLFGIHFVSIMFLTAVIRFVFGIDLGGNVVGIILVNLFGSMIGVSMGIMLGSIGKLSYNAKMGLTVLMTLFPGFLAGLMFGEMKNLIERTCPIINRINPAAVLSDAYYCMGVFNDTQRMTRNLLILLVMSVSFMVISFLATRRERYDSI